MSAASPSPDNSIPKGIRDDKAFTANAIEYFLQLPKHHYFRWCLIKSFPPLSVFSSTKEIQKFIQYDCGRKGKDGESLITPGGRHTYFRAIRCFFNWAYSPASGLELEPSKNPVTWVVAPSVPRRKMPAQSTETIDILLAAANNARDKAIISTFIDTGGRRAEVANIKESDIDWDKHHIRAICKGDREAFMPMGPRTEGLVRKWLAEYRPLKDSNIWGLKTNGLVMMLKRLERKTGIKCNAHTFRRGFACILRRNGVDSLDIKELGHWKSHRMVEHYTQDVSFEDAQKHYLPPMGPEKTKPATPPVQFMPPGDTLPPMSFDREGASRIVQIIPADGWKAVFSHEYEHGIGLERMPLVCWALVDVVIGMPDGSTDIMRMIQGMRATNDGIWETDSDVKGFLGFEAPHLQEDDRWMELYDHFQEIEPEG